ncbi:MAG: zf-HC2 domain-containing protein [Gemmatimonadaceae bacterium]
MDCQEFLEKHFAFVDDTLAGIELVGLQMHITECDECARQDTRVRRSLMLVRSLPQIEPSPEFASRLEKRLLAVKLADADAASRGGSGRLAASVMLASAAMLAYIGVSLGQVDAAHELSLPPVVATATAADAYAVNTPAPEMIASVPAGVPLWTGALLAEQTLVHFASMEMGSTGH